MCGLCLYGHYQEIVTCKLSNPTAIFSTTFILCDRSTSKHLYCRNQMYQGTTYSYIARHREGIARESQYVPSGRPHKRKASSEDCHTQTKRGKQDHTKRKHSLSLNVESAKPLQTRTRTLTCSVECLVSLS